MIRGLPGSILCIQSFKKSSGSCRHRASALHQSSRGSILRSQSSQSSYHIKAAALRFKQSVIRRSIGNLSRPSLHTVMSSLAGDTFFLDEFAFRQFEGGHASQLDIPKEEFVRAVHKLYHEA